MVASVVVAVVGAVVPSVVATVSGAVAETVVDVISTVVDVISTSTLFVIFVQQTYLHVNTAEQIDKMKIPKAHLINVTTQNIEHTKQAPVRNNNHRQSGLGTSRGSWSFHY